MLSACPPQPLHQAMAERVERGEFPGMVTVVARGDDVRVDTIGVTHFGGDVPMRRDTPFRIASMTKPVIAAATMLLVEDDLLDLEEPVASAAARAGRPARAAQLDAALDETVPRGPADHRRRPAHLHRWASA